MGRRDRIDVLADNAGGTFPKRVEIVHGHELTFQVDLDDGRRSSRTS